jgi:hypothetical protein
VTDGRPRGEVEDEDEEDPEPRYLITLVVLKTWCATRRASEPCAEK